MTEEQSIQWMIDFVTANPQATSADILNGLQQAGLTLAESSAAFNFTQMAWGRLHLEQLGVVLVDWYTCFNAHGELLAHGKLTEHPQYAAAVRLAPHYQSLDAFQKLANESNEVKQTLAALDANIPLEKFGLPPIYMMLENPTEIGLQRAQTYVESQSAIDSARVDAAAQRNPPQQDSSPSSLPTAPPRPPDPPKKSWWKLW
jgi:hypothetical protein